MKKKLLAVALALMMALSVGMTGCGNESSEDGTVFSIAIKGGFDTLNFFSTESMLVYEFLNLTCDSLIAYDEDYNAIPRLAESWDSNADGSVWTFHLRKDAKFNDGEPVTSADVKWTYENAGDSYMYSTHASGFDSIECPDNYTVIFNCENPKPDMLYQIIPILPKHIWAKQKDVTTYEPNEVVGSGPFIYDAERSSNGNYTFTKNADYWGDKPNIDVLVFSTYDTEDAAAQALLQGEVDACYELDKTTYDSLSKEKNVFLETFDQFSFEYLGYNLLDPLLSDQTIRYAIDYCFDRDKTIEMAYGGLAQAGYGVVSNEGFQYTPSDDIIREYSIDKANEILDEAGYVDTDKDGIREKDGKKLKFELIVQSERYSWESATVNMLIDNCKKAGIKIKCSTMEKTTVWDTCYDGNKDWQLNLDGWGGDADPGFILCLFRDWEAEQDAGYSTTAYKNTEYDAAYAKARTTNNDSERYNYIQECQKILYEDCPVTVIGYLEVVQAIDKTQWEGYSESGGLFQNERINTYMNIKPVQASE